MKQSEEERRLSRLWSRWKEHGSGDARNDLVEHYQYLVRRQVRRMGKKMPATLEFDEAEAVGNLGLMMAVERYNPSLGSAFETFAIAWIRGSILEWWGDQDWVPRAERERERRGEEVRITRVLSLEVLQGEARPNEEGWGHQSLAEQIPDPSPSPEEQAFTRLQYEAMEEYMAELDIADQLLLDDLFVREMPLQEASARRGHSKHWGLRAKKRIFAELRALIRKGEKG